MESFTWKNIFVVLIMTVILTAGVSFALRSKSYFVKQVVAVSINQSESSTINLSGNVNQNSLTPIPLPPPQKLSNPPAIIKSIYMTGYSAGSKSYLNYLSDLFKKTEINAVVIDVKNSEGNVSYASGAPDVEKYKLSNHAISDIDTLIRFLHDKNIYVIGRIAVFEDPKYAKARPELAVYKKAETTDKTKPVLWEDNNGLAWLDPSSKDAWDYNISLAKDALYHGFDEVNFDYVRFPTDGKTSNMSFPVWDGKIAKAEVIKEFFEYVKTNLRNDPPSQNATAGRGKISVDLFGLTTVNTDDMGIGQLLESAFENFDYVCPMVYPSHYANGFIGFKNPAEHPYEVIKYSMDSAIKREKSFIKNEQDTAIKTSEVSGSPASSLQTSTVAPVLIPLGKFRPWLQDFNMGADYTSEMVKQEIKATQDSLGVDFSGFMLWNPSNIYTQGAISK